MSKLKPVVGELHRSETNLARGLIALADRHGADQEIHHVAWDIARWSQEHVARLAEIGHRYDARLDPEPRWALPGAEPLARRLSSGLAGRPETGLLLLADLRRVHRKATGVSLDWELLAQAAQAMRKADLLELAQECHPETLRQMRWANAHLKVVSPQAIAS